MESGDDSLRVGRKRVTQIFRYLEALNQHRNPARRHLDDQLWHLWFRDLENHPSIRLASFADAPSSVDGTSAQCEDTPYEPDDDYVLKVRRPKLTPCPPPPELLGPWLERTWEEPAAELRILESRYEPDARRQAPAMFFQDDPRRQQAFERWRVQRDAWSGDEKPARAAMRLFEKLYEIRGQIEREGEKLELVLGDGILSWERGEGSVFHPILLQRLQLEFDPTVPEFSIVEADSPVELYSALFQSMPDVAGRALAKARQELEHGRYHPLRGKRLPVSCEVWPYNCLLKASSERAGPEFHPAPTRLFLDRRLFSCGKETLATAWPSSR